MPELFNITGTPQVEEEKHIIDIRARGKKDLVTFGKLFMPDLFNLSTLSSSQLRMANSLLDPHKRWVCNILPRGWAKSVIGGTAVLYYLYYNPEDVQEFVMYVSESASQSKDRIAFLKYQIKSNPRLNYYFGEKMNGKCKDTEQEFQTIGGAFFCGIKAVLLTGELNPK